MELLFLVGVLDRMLDQERQRAEQQLAQERQRAEQVEQRAQQMAERLRSLGIDPDAL